MRCALDDGLLFHSENAIVATIREDGNWGGLVFLANLAAGQVSIKYGFKGPLGAPVTACAAGVQAIGDTARLIRSGEADVAVCGGAEACVETVTIACFAAARALATKYNDTPLRASRPSMLTGTDSSLGKVPAWWSSSRSITPSLAEPCRLQNW